VAINNAKGNFDKALFYSLEMIKSIEATGDTAHTFYLYRRVAQVYSHLNQNEKSIYWYKRAVANGVTDPGVLYNTTDVIRELMIKDGKKKEALAFLLGIIKKNPPFENFNRMTVAMMMADSYRLLGNNILAEKYYLKMIELGQIIPIKFKAFGAYYRISEFYFQQKKYDKARDYLHQMLSLPRGIGQVDMVRNAHLMLFYTDSLMGNYREAIKNYQRYKLLTDSIFNISKEKQIIEIQSKYQKDQKVQELETKGKLQQLQINHAETVRDFIIGGAGLLSLSLCLGYTRYRQKQRSNLLLQSQQHEINLINQTLQLAVTEKETLLKEKDKLLIEKGWLLKEVHHRVKNNLQTVVSLLESQAAYLEDDALKAIEESSHRIYAMALIHQQLYQSEELRTIDVYNYLPELVYYLKDSFQTGNQIQIDLSIRHLELDASQAVPLGLILNEVITNAIKYAFPNNAKGHIIISMVKLEDETCILKVIDNGIGLLPGFNISKMNSLGMKLIRGLSKNIGGILSLQSIGGTQVKLIFKKEDFSNKLHVDAVA
jgi:two-component sensor histidine kinase/tetratricopeptide (TPR) repeat protein